MPAAISRVRSLKGLSALTVPSTTSLEDIPKHLAALIKHYNIIRLQKWWRVGLTTIVYCEHLVAWPTKLEEIHGTIKFGCRVTVPKYPHLAHGVSGCVQRKNPFLVALRELNLIKNKHMPIVYLFNSREVRLELLAGLIDSDGSLNYAESRYRFDQKDKKLVDAVSYLARSLGFRASMHINAMREVTLPQGTKIMSEMHYTFISGSGIEQIPCRTPRKQVNPNYEARSSYARYGAKAKSIGYGKYIGFELDGDGSFLLSDFTVATMPAVERETFVRTKRLKSGTRKTM